MEAPIKGIFHIDLSSKDNFCFDMNGCVCELVLLHAEDGDPAIEELWQGGEGAELLVERLLPLSLLALEVQVIGITEARNPDKRIDHDILSQDCRWRVTGADGCWTWNINDVMIQIL